MADLESRIADLESTVIALTELNAELNVAVNAMVQWFDAEDQNLGTFHDRIDLCAYAEWTARKACGQDVGEFKGVPQLIIVCNESEVADA